MSTLVSDAIEHLTTQEIEAGLDHIKAAPKDNGVVEMICIRPATDERVVLGSCEVSAEGGFQGDRWAQGKGTPYPDVQVTLMNSRCIGLLAQSKDRWQLAGDQLFVDLDLSNDNLQAGDQLAIGTAVLEVTKEPHNGCKKFRNRFGLDAIKYINSPVGKHLHLRGIYAKIVQGGVITVGDTIKKV